MNHKFFQNKSCEYFPCHKIKDESNFNCLFCFCPLYLLKEECGGGFVHTENGVKDCSKCTIVHNGEQAYDHVMSKMGTVISKAKK